MKDRVLATSTFARHFLQTFPQRHQEENQERPFIHQSCKMMMCVIDPLWQVSLRLLIFLKMIPLVCPWVNPILPTNHSFLVPSFHFQRGRNLSVCMHACVLRIFKIYSLSDFQVSNTVLFTIVTPLYITFPEGIHLITVSLYPLINISFPCPPPPLLPAAPSNHPLTLSFWEFQVFLAPTCEIIQ